MKSYPIQFLSVLLTDDKSMEYFHQMFVGPFGSNENPRVVSFLNFMCTLLYNIASGTDLLIREK